ncbi:MAG: MFS transporter, partial [Actinomycetota bacterium]|nr:MFS transporter [Actinomycetota bacterium]
MNRVRRAFATTFRSLEVRNYRLYFFGQIVSITGTWMQSVGQAWLMLQLTGSAVALGTVTALQFLPILLLGPWGGVVADRFDKRRLLVVTQTTSALLAVVLGTLVATGVVQPWMVYALAVTLGMVTLVDNPARQSFVMEMVGPEHVTNAVSLNSVVVNAGRIVGPAVAGVLIATVGIAVCFFVNGASYLAVIAGLLAMRQLELRRTPRAKRARGQLREGLRYAWSTRELRVPLLVMAVVGTLGFNFSVLLPLMARFAFHSGAAVYGELFSLMGVGAVTGGLVVAAKGQANSRLLAGSAVAFGVAILTAATAPTLAAEMVVIVAVGVTSITFISTANSILQLRSRDDMRGRVMALYAMVFLGVTPIGAPTVGFVAEHFGPRAALALGGAATLLAGLAAAWA